MLVLRVTGIDTEGLVWAEPVEWESESPRQVRGAHAARRSRPGSGRPAARPSAGRRGTGGGAGGPGDPADRHGAGRVIGIYHESRSGGRIAAIDKEGGPGTGGSSPATGPGRAGRVGRGRADRQPARLWSAAREDRGPLGDPSAPRSVSLIAIHEHGIPDDFPDRAGRGGGRRGRSRWGAREDLRDLPLVTIDPRMRATMTTRSRLRTRIRANPRHVVWIAIADVRALCAARQQLDREGGGGEFATFRPGGADAARGAVGDLCSLVAGEDRPCIAVRLTLDAEGHKIAHRFARG